MGVQVVDVFIETGRAAADLIADPSVSAMWDEPAVLPGYTIGGLAAHLARAVTTVETYVDGEPPRAGAERVDAGEYFIAALSDHDPISSDLHTGIRRRADLFAAEGQAAVSNRVEEALDRLARSDLDPARRLAVFEGMEIQLSEYLKTRLVELTVHSSDLARSVSLGVWPLPDEAWRIAADAAIAVALIRHGPRMVTLGLARSDVFPTPNAF
jgi:hypothetical protein